MKRLVLICLCTVLALQGLSLGAATQQGEYSLDFNPDNYTLKSVSDGMTNITVRAYEGVVYVRYPVDPKYERRMQIKRAFCLDCRGLL